MKIVFKNIFYSFFYFFILLEEPLRQMTKAGSKKEAMNVHKEFLLKLFNTGSSQDLQMMPQIGKKTAYQIITHRCLNGKFKNLEDVSKMPSWRGKAWERFQNVS